MDFVEYGECPLGRSGNATKNAERIKEEYVEAKRLAEEGKLDDIQAGIRLIYNRI